MKIGKKKLIWSCIIPRKDTEYLIACDYCGKEYITYLKEQVCMYCGSDFICLSQSCW